MDESFDAAFQATRVESSMVPPPPPLPPTSSNSSNSNFISMGTHQSGHQSTPLPPPRMQTVVVATTPVTQERESSLVRVNATSISSEENLNTHHHITATSDAGRRMSAAVIVRNSFKQRKNIMHESQCHEVKANQLYVMRTSPNPSIRCCHRCIVAFGFLDPVIWFISFLLLFFLVRPNIVNPDRSGWELTRRIRSMTSSYNNVDSTPQLFAYLRHQIVPALAPSSPTIEMRETFMNYVTEIQQQPLQTLSDGSLVVLGNTIHLRQIRSTSWFYYDGVEATGNDASAVPTISTWVDDISNTTTHSNYVDNDVSKNTETRSEVTGHAYSGSGFTISLDLSLDVEGPSSINDVPSATKRLEAGMETRQARLTHLLAAIEHSGWVDARTRVVFVEYCVVPFYLQQQWTRNRNTTTEADTKLTRLTQSTNISKTRVIGVGGCHRLMFEYDQFGQIDGAQTFITAPISSGMTKLQDSRKEITIVFAVLLGCLGFLLVGECLEIGVTGAKIYLCSRSRALFNMLDLTAVIFISLTLASFPSASMPFALGDSLTMSLYPNQTHLTFQRLKEMDASRQW